jgi:hypothetical protein
MMRAVVSVEPPGGNGLMRVTGRVGKVCAEAAPAMRRPIRTIRFFMDGKRTTIGAFREA